MEPLKPNGWEYGSIIMTEVASVVSDVASGSTA